MERILSEVEADIHVVDFHGETTAEKKAFVYEFKNKVSAVLGTHTHVQTADNQIIDGCAFISDVGMCGAYQSILGRDINEALAKMIRSEDTHYKVSNNPALLSGVIMKFNKSFRATSIERIYIKPEENHR
jgi:calcineurin-like phosphoesterase